MRRGTRGRPNSSYIMKKMPTPPPSPAAVHRTDWGSLAREVFGTFASFVWGQLVIAAALAVFITIGFYLVGLRFWWFAGPLAGALCVIPMAGPIVGAIPAMLIALLTGALETLLGTLAVLALAQVVEGLFLGPWILGRRLSLHPVLVFLAAIVGALLGGPLGAFLSAPLVAVALLVWKRVRAEA